MKKELRREILYLRDNLEDRYNKSMIIKDKLLNIDVYSIIILNIRDKQIKDNY